MSHRGRVNKEGKTRVGSTTACTKETCLNNLDGCVADESGSCRTRELSFWVHVSVVGVGVSRSPPEIFFIDR